MFPGIQVVSEVTDEGCGQVVRKGSYQFILKCPGGEYIAKVYPVTKFRDMGRKYLGPRKVDDIFTTCSK